MTISRRVRNKFTKSKYQVTLGMFIKSKIKCSDNSGAKVISIFGIFKTGSRLNRLSGACPGSMVVGSVKKGKTKLRKTSTTLVFSVTYAIIIRQKKIWRRSDGVHICFEDNACVIVNQKGELKCKKILGPVAKECALVWPRIAKKAHGILFNLNMIFLGLCLLNLCIFKFMILRNLCPLILCGIFFKSILNSFKIF
uniref:Ribosomal protein L23 n=1 Tax=Lotharella vacuolata TaxID=74820 RepID=A0A0H5BQV1_9EUKA|nr:ribosomal protein L23 [Lotharella vacuolata]